MWILALDTLTWTPVSGPAKSAPPTPSQNGDAGGDALAPVSQPLPPCAGHAMVAWGSKLLVVGGHMKVHTLQRDTKSSLASYLLGTLSVIKIIQGSEPLAIPDTCKRHMSELSPSFFPREINPLPGNFMKPQRCRFPIFGASAFINNRSCIALQAKDARKDLQVSAFDTQTTSWAVLEPSGTPPTSRGGHSVRTHFPSGCLHVWPAFTF